jgi:hypothetical protein
MSLGKIILYAMALGIMVDLITARLASELPAGAIGMATTLLATVVAGRLQPPPPKR